MRSLSFLFRHRLAAGLLLAGAGLAFAPYAQACMLDQRPSVSADGLLARVNQQPPTTEAQLAVWAPFIFAHNAIAGRTVTFTENRREVARSLTDAAMRRPWHWTFGDGHAADGWTVRHAYAHPGRWRISVDAYDPGTKRWYTFDQVEIVSISAPSAGQSHTSGKH